MGGGSNPLGRTKLSGRNMIREIITNKKTLRQTSVLSNIDKSSLLVGKDLIDTLVETWKTPIIGLAIAAPQIGRFERIIAVANNGQNVDDIEVMFNPNITYKSGKQVFWEYCMSGLSELSKVERPHIVEVTYYGENRNKKTTVKKGLDAIVLCHEIDHLDGIISQDIAIKNIRCKDADEAQSLKAKLRMDEPLAVLDYGKEPLCEVLL